jgi:phenylpyruvate tautomerase PptA (4-oxalocrotonate tautomerase family)
MPLINVKLIEDVFTPEQNATAARVSNNHATTMRREGRS